ncbi:endonuclease IV [Paenibacillus swuensis]|uniref:Endonuclease IV n=1 Tax=Paenibacillus swuensis TaxID=1178515 RepID=A0A172TQ15_9BACL|nr:deoxyribonuclease IV [Paenibacillus swuensis]ANE49004.1 endonuclease IV [Paenibacillus swuensis]
MYAGSHISTRKGYSGAAKTALAMGGKAFQYFPKNPRSLKVKAFNRPDAEACASYCLEHDILSIAHTPYPTSTTADTAELFQANVNSLLNDLEIADACGSVGIIVHFGTYKGKDPLQGYRNILQLLNEVLDAWHGTTLLLLENQAGEGGPMGTTMEEMMQIRSLLKSPAKVGFCFDTCHAFASGLWPEDDWNGLVMKGEAIGYWEHLKAIHLNDSLYPYLSHRDRHANIGKGYIGEERMRLLLQSSIPDGIPVVLETPSSMDGTHRDEIAKIYRLAEIGNES